MTSYTTKEFLMKDCNWFFARVLDANFQQPAAAVLTASR